MDDLFEQSITLSECNEGGHYPNAFSCGYACSYRFITSKYLNVAQALQICSYYNYTYAGVGQYEFGLF